MLSDYNKKAATLVQRSRIGQSTVQQRDNSTQVNKTRKVFEIRSSKFRHIYGSPFKKELCYEGIKITRSAHDSNFCAVNRQFIAIVTECAGGGIFVVLPLHQTGRIDVRTGRVTGHRAPVNDVKWNPFNDYVIASCSDDTTVKLWLIPESGIKSNLNECVVDLHGHCKRVTYMEWHPAASGILLSVATDLKCIIWNTETGSSIRVIGVHPDIIYSICWNRTGHLFATTCRDKRIRIIDARQGKIVTEGKGHLGGKASKIIFLGRKRNILFSTGFSKISERQYAIWNMNDLSAPLTMEAIDSSNGILIPHFDEDNSVVYIAGKGDGNIRYYEITDDFPYVHYLNIYQSGMPQRGLGVMPKRGVDVSRCEVMRFYKVHSLKDLCEPLSMIVPRKSPVFQPDIYPPTRSDVAALSAAEWIDGVDKEPTEISLQPDGLNLYPIKPQKILLKKEQQSSPSASTVSDSRHDKASKDAAVVDNKDHYRLSAIPKKSTKQSNATNATRQTAKQIKYAVGQVKSPLSSSFFTRCDPDVTKKENITVASVECIAKPETELRKHYLAQAEEIKCLKEQLNIKDKRIKQLTEELELLRSCASVKDNSGTSK